MERVKIAYKKYGKEKESTFKVTSNDDSLKKRYDIANIVLAISDDKFDEVRKLIKSFYE